MTRCVCVFAHSSRSQQWPTSRPPRRAPPRTACEKRKAKQLSRALPLNRCAEYGSAPYRGGSLSAPPACTLPVRVVSSGRRRQLLPPGSLLPPPPRSYVGSLAWAATDESLGQAFSQWCGPRGRAAPVLHIACGARRHRPNLCRPFLRASRARAPCCRGSTDAKVIYDRATGRSKGFGFVTFPDENAAKAAMGA
jgi:RNA recognition motif-containing protein